MPQARPPPPPRPASPIFTGSSRLFRPATAPAAAPVAAVRSVGAVPRPASASANSAAEPNRSAGSFSSAVITAASTCGGMVWRWGRMGRGDSVSTRATMACAVEPLNGGSPVSIS